MTVRYTSEPGVLRFSAVAVALALPFLLTACGGGKEEETGDASASSNPSSPAPEKKQSSPKAPPAAAVPKQPECLRNPSRPGKRPTGRRDPRPRSQRSLSKPDTPPPSPTPRRAWSLMLKKVSWSGRPRLSPQRPRCACFSRSVMRTGKRSSWFTRYAGNKANRRFPDWWSRVESNHHLRLRRPSSYPLDHGTR